MKVSYPFSARKGFFLLLTLLDLLFTLLAKAQFKVLINYPWDDCPGAQEGEQAPCPDDDVFKCLASLYADNHPFMWTG